MDEAGRIVLNVCKVTPNGVVVFFPSGAYAESVVARWAATGALANIGAVKQVFREPKTAAGVEAVLERYSVSPLRRPADGAPARPVLRAREGGICRSRPPRCRRLRPPR